MSPQPMEGHGYLVADVGLLDLDSHLSPVVEFGVVDLGNRGRGHGLAIEFGKDFVRGQAIEVFAKDLAHLVVVDIWSLILMKIEQAARFLPKG